MSLKEQNDTQFSDPKTSKFANKKIHNTHEVWIFNKADSILQVLHHLFHSS